MDFMFIPRRLYYGIFVIDDGAIKGGTRVACRDRVLPSTIEWSSWDC
jgi:hypothetical protein